MSRLLIALSLVLLSVAPKGAQAAGEYSTAQELVTAVEKVYGDVESIRADFVQVSRSAILGDEHRQQGSMTLKRPRKMRWEFRSPDNKLFVTDGQTMWVWAPAENQVIVYRDFSTGASGVTSLLADMGRLHEMFEVTLVGGPDANRKEYVLDLKPLTGQGDFKTLRLVLSRKLMVERVTMVDAMDNVTDLSFSGMTIDDAVTDGEFTFQVPAGAEVIAPEGS